MTEHSKNSMRNEPDSAFRRSDSAPQSSSSSPLQHIIWDWNGTLLDDITASFKSINAMLADSGLPVLSLEKYREIFNFPLRPCYEVMGFDVKDQQDWDRVARQFHDHYDGFVKNSNLRDGIEDILDMARSQSIAMSVLSASEQGILERMLSDWKIDDYFEHIRGKSDLYGESKLGVARAMMYEMGTDPRDVLLVGDTTHDYEVANDLNCRCILLTGGHQSEERLRACDCKVIVNLQEFRSYIESGTNIDGQ